MSTGFRRTVGRWTITSRPMHIDPTTGKTAPDTIIYFQPDMRRSRKRVAIIPYAMTEEQALEKLKVLNAFE
jgi:hypothetical protein